MKKFKEEDYVIIISEEILKVNSDLNLINKTGITISKNTRRNMTDKFRIGEYVLITGESDNNPDFMKSHKNKIVCIKRINKNSTYPFFISLHFNVNASEIKKLTNEELILARLRGQLN